MGELWRAEAGEGFTKGEQIVVMRMDGFTLHVQRASNSWPVTTLPPFNQ
jgi:membrane protein implicated in regulation of membrane protease activity